MFCASTLASCDGIRHGFFTRQGGVSSGIYGSLNCGLGSRDDAESVQAEPRPRRRDLGRRARTGCSRSTKSTAPTAVIADKPWDVDARPRPTPSSRARPASPSACSPPIARRCCFAIAQARVIGAAHAGWRGALSGIVEATVAAMEELGAKRERIAAVDRPLDLAKGL